MTNDVLDNAYRVVGALASRGWRARVEYESEESNTIMIVVDPQEDLQSFKKIRYFAAVDTTFAQIVAHVKCSDRDWDMYMNPHTPKFKERV